MSDEVLLEVFRQNFENMRHAERERTSFTQFYALVVAGVLGFMSYTDFIYVRPLWLLLFFFSLFGFFASFRWRANIEADIDKAKDTAAMMPKKLEEAVSHGDVKGWTRHLHLGWIFICLYSLASLIFLILAIIKVEL